MTNPNEPTLTCSEVVERLAECADIEYTKDKLGGIYTATFNRAKATKILHSWRERRVQESEAVLDALNVAIAFARNPQAFDADTLYNSFKKARDEWREQIRKGAKHE